MTLTDEDKYQLLTKDNFKYNDSFVRQYLSNLRNNRMNLTTIRSILYVLLKLMSRIVDGIFINLDLIEKLKAEVEKDKNTRLVFMCLNRSLADQIYIPIISYYTNV